ncbi:hypothetical protein GCM10027586_09490 [Kineococcus gypseus]|uniref:hypothetical protein n=1 Tax=Kineococcus gypseus TaxID=1637102 RepID=UPI003D7DCDC2
MTTTATLHTPIPNPTSAAASSASACAEAASVDEVLLARTDEGRWRTWRPRADAHLFIGGHQGSGGTNALRAAVMGWTAAGGAAFLIHPTHSRLQSLREWPGVQAVAGQGEVHAAIAIVHALHAEMERRHAQACASEGQLEHTPLLLAIDEFTDLRGWCHYAWSYEDDASRRATRELLVADRACRRAHPQTRRHRHHPASTPEATALSARADTDEAEPPDPAVSPTLIALEHPLREGRGVGIHLAVRAAHCAPEAVGTLQHFGQRVWLGKASALESQLMWHSVIGAEFSGRVPGRAVCSNAHRLPVKAQVVWTSDPGSAGAADHELLQRMSPRTAAHEPLQLTAPEPSSAGFGYAQWAHPQVYRTLEQARIAHLNDQRPWLLPRWLHPQAERSRTSRSSRQQVHA